MENTVFSSKDTAKKYFTVFIVAMLMGIVIFTPFLVFDKGLFIYYGDFNVQQIPFYQMCHDMVRNGEMGWNWYTDLGSSFIGSYAFYLLGSPFFWLTIPFPSEAVPYLMAPLLILKMAVAAVTSYGYLKRFVKNDNYAMIGGLLYAFSGYSIYNIFFNHFHEVIAFFPLLLIGVEEFVVNKRRGMFALAVALNAVVNYYFFFGEVIFVVIYFFVRLSYGGDFKLNFGRFLLFAFEAVLGLLMSAFLLLPAILIVLGNPRMESLLLGWNGVFFGNVQRYGLILSSLFFPPDIPAYPNLFPDSNAKWSSVSLFLPLFSTMGVFAYFKKRGRHWGRALLLISLFIAFVPLLNSAFSAFNSSYYARWFYMPLLIMAMFTVKALEDCSDEELNFGFKWTIFPVVCFTALAFWPSKKDDEIVFGQLIEYPERFWAYFAIVVMGFILYKALMRLRGKKAFFKAAMSSTAFVAMVMSILMMSLGKGNANVSYRVAEMSLHGRENLTFLSESTDDNFFRTDTYCDGDRWCQDNFCMFWQTPALQAFQSVVPGSVFSFYESIGVERSVASRPSIDLYSLRALTSTKYLLCYEDDEEAETDGFTYLTTEGGFKIYTNDCYIPIGFTYDYYLKEEDFKAYSKAVRCDAMLSAIVLSEEQAAVYQDILVNLKEQPDIPVTGDEAVRKAAADRSATACSSFVRDKNGFTATITTENDELLFFSIPFENGWSATVNGEAVVVENVNNGMMAVRVPAGESTVRFDYKTPGFMMGLMITAGAFLVWALYLLIVKLALRERSVIFRRVALVKDNIAAEDAFLRTLSSWTEVQLNALEETVKTEQESIEETNAPPAEPQIDTEIGTEGKNPSLPTEPLGEEVTEDPNEEPKGES